MRTSTRTMIIGAAIAWALCGCAEDRVCARGATQACVCPGASQGAQVCSRDGMGWGPCGCAQGATAPNVVVPDVLPEPNTGAPSEPVPQAPHPSHIAHATPTPATATREEGALPGAHDHGPAAPAATDGPQPTHPSRSDVTRVLGRLSGPIAACGGGEHGTVTVRMTISGSGRVRSADVSGSFAGTPVGTCVARVVRRARFPAFSSDTFSVTYPFRL